MIVNGLIAVDSTGIEFLSETMHNAYWAAIKMPGDNYGVYNRTKRMRLATSWFGGPHAAIATANLLDSKDKNDELEIALRASKRAEGP